MAVFEFFGTADQAFEPGNPLGGDTFFNGTVDAPGNFGGPITFTFSVSAGRARFQPNAGTENAPTTFGSITISGTATTAVTPAFNPFTFTTYADTPAQATATFVLNSGRYFDGITLNTFLSTNGDGSNQATVSVQNSTGLWAQLTKPTQAFVGDVYGIRFKVSTGDQLYVESISSNGINCFAGGTRISTPAGYRAVETLRENEAIHTNAGLSRIKWIARQAVDTTFAAPSLVAPIRIRAGAFGAGRPLRDLRVTPDHGIVVGDHLINAAALVNGRTIVQETLHPGQSLTYYHIETEAHEVLLAEGVPAETFIDYAPRAHFDNGVEAPATVIAELPLPRISAVRALPQHIRDRLEYVADQLMGPRRKAA